MRGKTEQSARKKKKWFHITEYGKIFNGDSYHFISGLRENSVDLIVTSPPFGLVRKKEYGNVPADEYLDWLRPYATQLHRILKKSGSLVIDIGGAWNKGEPTRHLYHFELLIIDSTIFAAGFDNSMILHQALFLPHHLPVHIFLGSHELEASDRVGRTGRQAQQCSSRKPES